MYYIYCYTNKVTNRKYIGQTNNIDRRKREHLSCANNELSKSYNDLFHKKLREYGEENFIFSILEEINTQEEADAQEKYWIEQFRQWEFNLTNITSGGEGACNSAQWNNKVVSCFDVNGNYIETFNSIKSAAIKYNISHGHIISALKGKLILCKNLQWRYGDNIINIAPIIIYGNMTKHLKIAQYDLNDNPIKIFESVKHVSLQLNIKSVANIYQCINNKRKTAYGYKWKLYTEPIL